VAKSAKRKKDSGVLSELLRQVRQEQKVTQNELAIKLGFPQSRISKVEAGDRRMDLLELHEWCKAVGFPLLKFVQKFEKALKGE
jgi:transcriptional regulator with XRE-family HTH domain